MTEVKYEVWLQCKLVMQVQAPEEGCSLECVCAHTCLPFYTWDWIKGQAEP